MNTTDAAAKKRAALLAETEAIRAENPDEEFTNCHVCDASFYWEFGSKAGYFGEAWLCDVCRGE